MEDFELMKTVEELEVGNLIRFTEFSYTNTVGGTGSANSHPSTNLDSLFTGIAEGRIVYKFHDYECGWRFHVALCEMDWVRIRDVATENKVYVSQFDLISWGLSYG